MDAFGLLVTVAAVGVGVAALKEMTSGTPRRGSSRQVWRQAADTLGGHCIENSAGSLVLVAHVDGLQVTIDHYLHQTSARVLVDAPGFEMDLHETGVVGRLGAGLTTHHVTSSDAGFDAVYAARSNQPLYAAAWLDEAARAAVRGCPGASFRVRDGIASAQLPYLLDESASLVTLARAIAGFAGGAARLRGRWARAAGVLGGRLGAGSAGLAAEVLGAAGIVRFVVDPARAETVVSLENARGGRGRVTLAGVEPDGEAWRVAMEQVTRQVSAVTRDVAPYR